RDAARLGAMGAAVVVAVGFDSVAHDLAVAVLAFGRERVNGALEAVEDVAAAGERHFEGFVVVVAANLADRHRRPPPDTRLVSASRARAGGLMKTRKNQSRASLATSASSPGCSKRWPAPGTTASSFSHHRRANASRLSSRTCSSAPPTIKRVAART